jgi:hypothetical protein
VGVFFEVSMPIPEGKLPPLSHQLVEELNQLYPAQCIASGDTLEVAHRYAGKRELVETLLRLLNQPEDNVLST